MRRIKFRGKREDNGEWVYGAFYPIKDEPVYFIINNCQSIDFDDNSTFFNGYKVHKKSVGQFTGLHDKNGKEIYEGDIVKDEFGRIMKIEYWNHRLCFVAISKTNFHHADFYDWVYRDISTDLLKTETEIIGNSFENPELL